MHYQPEVDEASKKPEVIEFYNSTKGGVDTFDKMVHSYSVSRKTRRWPLRMFYGILDQAGINSMILYGESVHSEGVNRRKFLKELGFQLAKQQMEERLESQLPNDLRSNIQKLLGIEDSTVGQPPPAKLPKQARCHLCPRKKDMKVKISCAKCMKPVCRVHRKDICDDCLKSE
ncbi:uncharacterized protein LOC120352834 [Nilaparvata lugens]|uniref:uncharacterized protein LOC120352834 n=1 Tax=Nilaparvata lugens TaxID=108931 RepID=UPI00193D6ABC|nr:uncharacterized protein LOC120352834 [Nilaparvata lugens]